MMVLVMGRDDTLQLTAPEDASMDLMGMNFNSPFKIPASTSMRATSAVVASDNSVEQTPQPKQLRTATASTRTPTRTISTSSTTSSSTTSSSAAGSATPNHHGSAVRRSGLPRPVSMIHSPSPPSSAAGAGVECIRSRVQRQHASSLPLPLRPLRPMVNLLLRRLRIELDVWKHRTLHRQQKQGRKC